MANFQEFLFYFEKFIDDSKLKEEEKLISLSGQKIAISGSLFFKKLLSCVIINPCKGLLLSQISQQIANFNSIFVNNGVRYIIVFQGMNDFEYNYYPDYKSNLKGIVREMWKSLIKMDYEQSFTQLKHLYPFFLLNFRAILTVLEEFGIEYMISPYNELAQIRKLYAMEYVNALAADLDFLAFTQGLSNFCNMIMDFDFDNHRFYWIDQKKLQMKLQISTDQINEFFLLAGIMNITPLIKMPIDKETLKDTNIFQFILAAERRKENITNLVETEVMSTYHVQRKKLENMPILSSTCEIEIYTSKEYIDKMKEFFGSFLPLQLYLFLSFNLISRDLVFALSRTKIYSKMPVADSLELRSLIENEFIVYYKKIFSILTAHLSNPYKKISLSLYKYYEVKDKPILISNILAFTMPKLCPMASIISRIKEKSQIKGMSFIHALQVFLNLLVMDKNDSVNTLNMSPDVSTNVRAEEQKVPDEKKANNHNENSNNLNNHLVPYPSNFEEIACFSKLLFLHILEYLNLDSKEITVIGSGLRKIDENLEESIIIILELMKSSVNHLYGKPICDAFKIRKLSFEQSPLLNNRLVDNKLFSQDKIKEEFNLNTFLNVLENERDEEKESLITCISRIFAFVTPSIQYNKLRNVYDYDLSQYLAILQYTQNLMNDLYESILFNLFVNGEKKVKNYVKFFFDDAKKNLGKTFKNCYNIDIAIAIKMILQMKDMKEVEVFCNNDEKVLTALKHDLEKGMKLWIEIINLLKYQEKKGVYNQELNKLFIKADELLQEKLKDLKIL